MASGIPAGRILLDPGFGFGKTLTHNLTLLARLRDIAALGPPLLVGLSRKSMLGAITGRPVTERLAGSLAAALLAVERGAVLVRAHDVAETVDALAVVACEADTRGRRAGMGQDLQDSLVGRSSASACRAKYMIRSANPGKS